MSQAPHQPQLQLQHYNDLAPDIENRDTTRLEKALTSKKWRFLFYDRPPAPETVLEALGEQLPHIEPQSWTGRLAIGGVFVNGKPCRADGPLPLPCSLEYFEPLWDYGAPEIAFPRLTKNDLVYQDEAIVVAQKPAGLPCLPVREQVHFHLRGELQRLFGESVSLHLPSRLDTSAFGLVLVSKSPRTHATLQRFYEQHRVIKHYLLLLSGVLPKPVVEIDAAIGKDDAHPILRRVRPDGKNAFSRFEEIARQEFAGQLCSLVRAIPKTGRTHQLRVHTAHLGLPIVGDNFYNGLPADNLHLASYKLIFPHPVSGTPTEITLPDHFHQPWMLC